MDDDRMHQFAECDRGIDIMDPENMDALHDEQDRAALDERDPDTCYSTEGLRSGGYCGAPFGECEHTRRKAPPPPCATCGGKRGRYEDEIPGGAIPEWVPCKCVVER